MQRKLLHSMPRMGGRRNNQGSGLLEVLVLVFVMAVGMLAMGKMHTVLMRDGGTANNRAIATSLAQEKLDDLRGFTFLNATDAGNNGQNCGDDVFCYDEITVAGNTGGSQTGGVLDVPSGNITLGNTTFNRTWTTTRHTATGAAATDEAATAYKQVTVTVAWTDQNGAHSVQLTSAILKDDPLTAAFTAAGTPTGGGYGPKVEYTRGIAPDVVAVPITQGSVSKETSKPLPDVVSAGSSVATSFETVTYVQGGTDTKQQLDDFLTISCVCKFANPVSGSGYPASFYTWDADSKVLKVKYPTDPVTKNGGVVNASGQHVLCAKCCNDHHDTTGTTTALYDTERPDTDYTSGDHKHYYYVNPSNPNQGLQEVTPAPNAPYLEACRFLRVDGFYRLMQDWVAKDMTVMPKDDYLTNSGTLSAYQTYVTGVIKHFAGADCTAASGTDCVSAAMPSKSSLPTRNLNDVTTAQLLSRAVYMDRVYSEDAPRTLDSDYYTALAAKITANQLDPTKSWLDIVPFNEVNTTLLTSWYTRNGSTYNPSGVTVTNETIVDITAPDANYYGSYSRGAVTVTSGSADVYAVLLPSNSGLTGGAKPGVYSSTVDYPSGTIPYPSEIGIDQHDHSTANRLSNALNVDQGAATGVSGFVSMGNASADLDAVTVTLSGTPCTLSGQGTSWTFTCTASTGTLAITSTVGTAFFDHGLDATYDSESSDGYQTTYSGVSGPGSGGTFWVFGSTSEVRGSISCSPATACSEVTVTAYTTSTGTTTACQIEGGTTVRCPVPLDASKAWSGTVTISNVSGFSNNLGAVTSGTCTPSGSGAKTTGTITGGPTDIPSAVSLCVTAGTALLPCTLGSTTIQSGETLTAYSSPSVTWPTVCTSIDEVRTCNNGTLSPIGFSPAYDTCYQVQVTPAIIWTGTAPNRSISWTGITDATGYKVYTCTTPNQNNLTSCTPSTYSTTTTDTSYGPVNPGNKDTICLAIKATTGVTDSYMSNTACVHQKNESYTYTP